MIKVLVNKSSKDRISSVTIEGHAFYNKKGKDIVCSAVSALTIGAINSTKRLLNIDLMPIENEKNGYLFWDIPEIEDDYIDDQLQLLMKSMIESLLMIEDEYKKYIQIRIETS